MQLINKDSDYAIRTLMFLSANKQSNNSLISIREISVKEKIPYQFLRRIAQKLAKKGYIESKDGVSGGIKLKVSTKEISISEILKIFQGEIELLPCVFQKKLCENSKTCVLREKIKRIEKGVIEEFENITIQSLVTDLKNKGR